MKAVASLLLTALFLGPVAVGFAQQSTPPPSGRRITRPPSQSTMPTASSDASKLTRFDLDFPGGTPAQLAVAISEATGKHLNLIIPTEQAETKIMPIAVKGVTVPELFTAISSASYHRVSVPLSGGPIETFDVAVKFLPSNNNNPVSDETIWAFSSSAPEVEEMVRRAAKPAPASAVCRYFQLGPYLENYSIEDITTAIQTGWKMAKVDPLPQLSFHKETKLLIAVGTEASVNQIPDVLTLLIDRTPAVEKLVKLQTELDEATAKKDDARAAALRDKMLRIAQRQNANELINRPSLIYSRSPQSTESSN